MQLATTIPQLHFSRGAVLRFSDPEHLSKIALVHGMQTPPLDQARVIELGCGDGHALLSLAMRLPDALFVGVDSSSANSRVLTDTARRRGLRNIVCVRSGWDAAAAAPGTYDYVICNVHPTHATPSAPSALLALCKELLRPSGIACLSYAVEPTWQVCRRGASPNAAYLHSQQRPSASSNRGHVVPYLLTRPTGSAPLLFADFLSLLDMHHLQFICESDIDKTLPTYLRPEVRYLASSCRMEDVIAREQYADVELGRRVRHSLITRYPGTIERDLTLVTARLSAELAVA